MAKEEAEAAAKAIELRDKYSELQEMNNRIKELKIWNHLKPMFKKISCKN